MTQVTGITEAAVLHEQFCRVRQQSEKLCAPLSPEDMMVQSSPDASPTKWHLAHTTWFFETFLLQEFLPGYREFDPAFHWLFNSYYNAISDQPEKRLRASFSRPSLETILDYRRHVEGGIRHLVESNLPDDLARRIELGINHEQQHQELLVTDIKHALWTNPLHPAYLERSLRDKSRSYSLQPMEWVDHEGGLIDIGFGGEGFSFDNERPRHTAFLRPFRLASRPVSCAEFLEFIQDGGYGKSEYWLAAGWETAKEEGWQAPLYWRRHGGKWHVYTLRGEVELQDIMESPVCHVSYFEADAFANWAQKRLPTEAEWEVAAWEASVGGNLLESGHFHPLPEPAPQAARLGQIFGDVWEWTQSPYVAYPGFRALPGALGEYNGKFMCNQMVLRGGSAVTPASHIRATYRNFFPPQTRWQFSGIRLAEP